MIYMARYSGDPHVPSHLPFRQQASIHCSNEIHYPHWGRVNIVGKTDTFCMLCSDIVYSANA